MIPGQERVVGVVPRAVAISIARKDYSLTVTNRRLVIVLEKRVNMALSFLVSGFAGTAGGLFMEQVGPGASGQFNPDALVALPGAISIPYEQLSKVRFFKEFGGNYMLHIHWRTPTGKETKESFAIAPPFEWERERKRQGEKLGDTLRWYADASQAILKAGLPPMIAQASQWLK